jgi:hypothetical protein
MALPRLSSNQRTVLHALNLGIPQGPSLSSAPTAACNATTLEDSAIFAVTSLHVDEIAALRRDT